MLKRFLEIVSWGIEYGSRLTLRGLGVAVVCLVSVAAFAAPPPITHIAYRPISKNLKAESFEASTRELWRAGDYFLRVEEAPDPAQHIHGVLIANAPNSWFWNRYGNVARHFVDRGPTINVVASVFPWVKSMELVQQLQMGRERQFFNEHHASRLPDTSIDGVAVTAQIVAIDGYKVTMFTRKDNGKPFQLVLDGSEESFVWRYDVFEEGLPFDPALFVLPTYVRVVEDE